MHWVQVLPPHPFFVDQSYSGSSPDGSQSKPYPTIGAALKSASAGAHIAVAAGTYKEGVVIDKKVTLQGRCAQMMTITGAGKYTVEVKSSATGSVLRHLAIKGADRGLLVYGASITADHMVVQGCEGRGIQVQSGGTLSLRDSLVAGNRDGGIVLFGSKASVERGVVRDTREWATDKKFGEGIYADVDLSGQGRGSELVLRDSLVAGNRTAGISMWSSKATVERSVVRDSREQASDKKSGVGIRASVSSGQSQGSELTLRDSLVAENRYMGVLLFSSQATLERAVVRDTHEDALSKKLGGGIYAGVDTGQSRGSELTLSDSLVVGNQTAGIELRSSKATVKRSVVRGTREQASDQKGGVGIIVSVGFEQSQGSELTLHDSLVASNRQTGISLWSSKATVRRSTVRDTREQASDKSEGAGITASVAPEQSQGSELTLSDSLVARNRDVGILLFSSKASVQNCVVRDTLERASDRRSGHGIMASIESGQSQGSELTLSDSLVASNRSAGISLFSSKATVQNSVVRDTLEDASDKGLGMGIAAVFLSGQSLGSELTLNDSLVAGNRAAGIDLEGSKATVQRSVVRDTRERASDKKYGSGIQVAFYSGQSRESELTLRDSLVAGNRNVGIDLYGSKATVQRSVVRDTRKDGLGHYGDGLLAADKSTLHASDTTVERNARAGFLFTNSGGSIHRCLIRGNVFAIDLGNGDRPTIGTDNTIMDNKENDVSSSNLKIAPPSKPPKL